MVVRRLWTGLKRYRVLGLGLLPRETPQGKKRYTSWNKARKVRTVSKFSDVGQFSSVRPPTVGRGIAAQMLVPSVSSGYSPTTELQMHGEAHRPHTAGALAANCVGAHQLANPKLGHTPAATRV